MFKRGDQVVYLPDYKDEKLRWKSADYGFVTSQPNDEYCWVRYWRHGKPGQLRTRSCSELTPIANLVLHESVKPEVVKQVMETEVAKSEHVLMSLLQIEADGEHKAVLRLSEIRIFAESHEAQQERLI